MESLLRHKRRDVAMVIRQFESYDLSYVEELASSYNLDYSRLLEAFAEACLDYIDANYKGAFYVSRAAIAVGMTQEEHVLSIYHQQNQG